MKKRQPMLQREIGPLISQWQDDLKIELQMMTEQ